MAAALAATSKASNDSGPGKDSTDVAAAKAKKRTSITGTMVERFKAQTAEEIREQITVLQNEMVMETKGQIAATSSLKSQIGEALYKSGAKLPELVKQWSTSSKGVLGEANKVDFRKSIRAVVQWPNVKDIDAIFTTVDAEGVGTVHQASLTKLLNQMLDTARQTVSQADKIAERVSFYTSRMKTAAEVARATAQAEDADHRLETIANDKSLDTRLGAELLRRNAKIADLMKGVAGGPADAIDKPKFRNIVRSFGVDDTDDAIDGLFESLNTAGGESFDNEALKIALENLRDASVEADKEGERLKKKSVDLWKAAKMAQLEFKKLRKADEVDAQAKAVQEAAEAEERAKVNEERERLKAMKREEDTRRKAEEQAAYEAKIASRRASNAAGLGSVKVVNGKVV